MLKFFGTGTGFSPDLGNTAAYHIEGDRLFMIDCGALVYKRIMELRILDNIKYVNIYISHTHDDHVGSLGLFLFELYFRKFNMECKVNVYHHKNVKVPQLLELYGVPKEAVKLVEVYDDITVCVPEMSVWFKTVRQNHTPYLETYGLEMKINGKEVYYSADAIDIPEHILERLHNDEFDYFFQDVQSTHSEFNVHMSLYSLHQAVKKEFRHIVYLIHVDKEMDINSARELGFKFAIPTMGIRIPAPTLAAALDRLPKDRKVQRPGVKQAVESLRTLEGAPENEK